MIRMISLNNLLLVIVLMFFTNVKSQWETQNSGVKVELRDVSFVDSLNGWVLGDSATILHTSNGGKSWIRQKPPADTLLLNKIQFLNRNVGYIVGHNGLILATTDGGDNWLRKESGTNYSFWGLSFVNESRGWLTGSDSWVSRISSIILSTTDSGKTWKTKFFPGGKPPSTLHAIKFINDSIGIASGAPHFDYGPTFFITTTNAGEDWVLRSQTSSELFYLAPFSKDTVFAGGIALAYTTNGGIDWMYYKDFFQTYIEDLKTIGKNCIWFKGFDWISGHRIYKSTDRGNSWESYSVPVGIIIYSISPINDNTIFVVGKKGSILKFSDIKTSIREVNHNEQFILSQNYPNPFNSTTKISFYLPQGENVVIKVYDFLGKTIKTIAEGYKTAGYHTVEFDASDLSSGIYFYEIITQNYRAVKKALLLK